MLQKVSKHSADLQIYVPSSVYFYLSHVSLLPQIRVTSLSNCQIWLQIMPNLDATLFTNILKLFMIGIKRIVLKIHQHIVFKISQNYDQKSSVLF